RIDDSVGRAVSGRQRTRRAVDQTWMHVPVNGRSVIDEVGVPTLISGIFESLEITQILARDGEGHYLRADTRGSIGDDIRWAGNHGRNRVKHRDGLGACAGIAMNVNRQPVADDVP